MSNVDSGIRREQDHWYVQILLSLPGCSVTLTHPFEAETDADRWRVNMMHLLDATRIEVEARINDQTIS
jgi:hypothetical protein